MTNKNDGPGKGPAKPGGDVGAQKKPAALIDLKATEIAAPATPPSAGAASATTSAASSATTSVPSTRPPEPAKPAVANPAATAAAAATTASTKSGDGKPADTTGTVKPGDATSAAAKSAAAMSAAATSATAKSATASATMTGGAAPAQKAAAAVAPAAAKAKSPLSLTGTLSHMLAGIVGGFLALLGADTLSSQLGLAPPSSSAPSSEMHQRIAALEQAVKEGPQAPAALARKLAAAELRLAQIDDLSRSVKQLGDAQSALAGEARALGERAGGAGDAAARLVKLEETFAALAAAAASDPQKGRIPQLAAITGQIKDLEATLNTQLAAVRKSVGQEIDTRLAQTTEASEAARSGTQRLDRDLAGVKTDTARLGQRIDGLKADGDRLGAGLKSVEDGAAGLKAAVDGLKTDLTAQLLTVARPQDVGMAIAPISSKLAAVEQSLQGVVRSEEGRRSNAERIVLALELGNLKRAIDRGGRFSTELAEVQRIAGPRLELSALETLKDQGVPTTADLLRDFRDVAHRIIEADGEHPDASVVDRLLTGAKSIVRVRKVSAGADDKSVEAVVARMEAAVRDQRFGEVVDESRKLSAKAAQPAKAWLARLEGRVAIDRAVAQVEAQLKASLGGKAQ